MGKKSKETPSYTNTSFNSGGLFGATTNTPFGTTYTPDVKHNGYSRE